MDKAADEQRLNDALASIEAWKREPYTAELLQNLALQRHNLTKLICTETPKNLEDLITHFVMMGHLKGLFAIDDYLEDRIEEINKQKAEL